MQSGKKFKSAKTKYEKILKTLTELEAAQTGFRAIINSIKDKLIHNDRTHSTEITRIMLTLEKSIIEKVTEPKKLDLISRLLSKDEWASESSGKFTRVSVKGKEEAVGFTLPEAEKINEFFEIAETAFSENKISFKTQPTSPSSSSHAGDFKGTAAPKKKISIPPPFTQSQTTSVGDTKMSMTREEFNQKLTAVLKEKLLEPMKLRIMNSTDLDEKEIDPITQLMAKRIETFAKELSITDDKMEILISEISKAKEYDGETQKKFPDIKDLTTNNEISKLYAVMVSFAHHSSALVMNDEPTTTQTLISETISQSKDKTFTEPEAREIHSALEKLATAKAKKILDDAIDLYISKPAQDLAGENKQSITQAVSDFKTTLKTLPITLKQAKMIDKTLLSRQFGKEKEDKKGNYSTPSFTLDPKLLTDISSNFSSLYSKLNATIKAAKPGVSPVASTSSRSDDAGDSKTATSAPPKTPKPSEPVAAATASSAPAAPKAVAQPAPPVQPSSQASPKPAAAANTGTAPQTPATQSAANPPASSAPAAAAAPAAVDIGSIIDAIYKPTEKLVTASQHLNDSDARRIRGLMHTIVEDMVSKLKLSDLNKIIEAKLGTDTETTPFNTNANVNISKNTTGILGGINSETYKKIEKIYQAINTIIAHSRVAAYTPNWSPPTELGLTSLFTPEQAKKVKEAFTAIKSRQKTATPAPSDSKKKTTTASTNTSPAASSAPAAAPAAPQAATSNPSAQPATEPSAGDAKQPQAAAQASAAASSSAPAAAAAASTAPAAAPAVTGQPENKPAVTVQGGGSPPPKEQNEPPAAAAAPAAPKAVAQPAPAVIQAQPAAAQPQPAPASPAPATQPQPAAAAAQNQPPKSAAESALGGHMFTREDQEQALKALEEKLKGLHPKFHKAIDEFLGRINALSPTELQFITDKITKETPFPTIDFSNPNNDPNIANNKNLVGGSMDLLRINIEGTAKIAKKPATASTATPAKEKKDSAASTATQSMSEEKKAALASLEENLRTKLFSLNPHTSEKEIDKLNTLIMPYIDNIIKEANSFDTSDINLLSDQVKDKDILTTKIYMGQTEKGVLQARLIEVFLRNVRVHIDKAKEDVAKLTGSSSSSAADAKSDKEAKTEKAEKAKAEADAKAKAEADAKAKAEAEKAEEKAKAEDKETIENIKTFLTGQLELEGFKVEIGDTVHADIIKLFKANGRNDVNQTARLLADSFISIAKTSLPDTKASDPQIGKITDLFKDTLREQYLTQAQTFFKKVESALFSSEPFKSAAEIKDTFPKPDNSQTRALFKLAEELGLSKDTDTNTKEFAKFLAHEFYPTLGKESELRNIFQIHGKSDDKQVELSNEYGPLATAVESFTEKALEKSKEKLKAHLIAEGTKIANLSMPLGILLEKDKNDLSAIAPPYKADSYIAAIEKTAENIVKNIKPVDIEILLNSDISITQLKTQFEQTGIQANDSITRGKSTLEAWLMSKLEEKYITELLDRPEFKQDKDKINAAIQLAHKEIIKNLSPRQLDILVRSYSVTDEKNSLQKNLEARQWPISSPPHDNISAADMEKRVTDAFDSINKLKIKAEKEYNDVIEIKNKLFPPSPTSSPLTSEYKSDEIENLLLAHKSIIEEANISADKLTSVLKLEQKNSDDIYQALIKDLPTSLGVTHSKPIEALAEAIADTNRKLATPNFADLPKLVKSAQIIIEDKNAQLLQKRAATLRDILTQQYVGAANEKEYAKLREKYRASMKGKAIHTTLDERREKLRHLHTELIRHNASPLAQILVAQEEVKGITDKIKNKLPWVDKKVEKKFEIGSSPEQKEAFIQFLKSQPPSKAPGMPSDSKMTSLFDQLKDNYDSDTGRIRNFKETKQLITGSSKLLDGTPKKLLDGSEISIQPKDEPTFQLKTAANLRSYDALKKEYEDHTAISGRLGGVDKLSKKVVARHERQIKHLLEVEKTILYLQAKEAYEKEIAPQQAVLDKIFSDYSKYHEQSEKLAGQLSAEIKAIDRELDLHKEADKKLAKETTDLTPEDKKSIFGKTGYSGKVVVQNPYDEKFDPTKETLDKYLDRLASLPEAKIKDPDPKKSVVLKGQPQPFSVDLSKENSSSGLLKFGPDDDPAKQTKYVVVNVMLPDKKQSQVQLITLNSKLAEERLEVIRDLYAANVPVNADEQRKNQINYAFDYLKKNTSDAKTLWEGHLEPITVHRLKEHLKDLMHKGECGYDNEEFHVFDRKNKNIEKTADKLANIIFSELLKSKIAMAFEFLENFRASPQGDQQPIVGTKDTVLAQAIFLVAAAMNRATQGAYEAYKPIDTPTFDNKQLNIVENMLIDKGYLGKKQSPSTPTTDGEMKRDKETTKDSTLTPDKAKKRTTETDEEKHRKEVKEALHNPKATMEELEELQRETKQKTDKSETEYNRPHR